MEHIYTIEFVLGYCTLDTIRRIRTTNKNFNQMCHKFLLNNCYINTDKLRIEDSKVYESYKTIRCAFVRDQKMLKNFCNIKFIYFHYDFNEPIKTIPPTTTRIIFGKFNQQIDNILPETLTHLRFGDKFNKPISVMLPQSLKHLTFGDEFDRPIDDILPSELTHLTFGAYFDKPIVKTLPNTLTHLSFGFFFDQPINHVLPYGLTHLSFGYCYNQLIEFLPPTLTHLTLGVSYKYPIRHVLPGSLKSITVRNIYKHIKDIPKHLLNVI